MLSSRVTSFLDIYQEQYNLTKILGDIYVTGKEYADNDNKMVENLASEKDRKITMKNQQRHRIECLKVSKDKKNLEAKKEEIKKLDIIFSTNQIRLKEFREDYNLKESINEYIEYLSDKKKYEQYEDLLKEQVSGEGFDKKELSTIVYNLKIRNDIEVAQLSKEIDQTNNALDILRNKKSYDEKLLNEAQIQLGANVETKKRKEEEIAALSEKLSALRMSLSQITFNDVKEQIKENKSMIEQLETDNLNKNNNIKLWQEELSFHEINIKLLEKEIEDKEKELTELERKTDEYNFAKEKLENIKEIYNETTEEMLIKAIQKRITMLVVDLEKNRSKKLELEKEKIRLNENRLFKISEAAQKVIDYIETRHGIRAMFGMDYLSALPNEKKKSFLILTH